MTEVLLNALKQRDPVAVAAAYRVAAHDAPWMTPEAKYNGSYDDTMLVCLTLLADAPDAADCYAELYSEMITRSSRRTLLPLFSFAQTAKQKGRAWVVAVVTSDKFRLYGPLFRSIMACQDVTPAPHALQDYQLKLIRGFVEVDPAREFYNLVYTYPLVAVHVMLAYELAAEPYTADTVYKVLSKLVIHPLTREKRDLREYYVYFVPEALETPAFVDLSALYHWGAASTLGTLSAWLKLARGEVFHVQRLAAWIGTAAGGVNNDVLAELALAVTARRITLTGVGHCNPATVGFIAHMTALRGDDHCLLRVHAGGLKFTPETLAAAGVNSATVKEYFTMPDNRADDWHLLPPAPWPASWQYAAVGRSYYGN